MTEHEAIAAMIEAGRALVALHPEIDGIRLTVQDTSGRVLVWYDIPSAEREWEMKQEAEWYRREREEAAALRRARGEAEPSPPWE
jgi:hypothetical protein